MFVFDCQLKAVHKTSLLVLSMVPRAKPKMYRHVAAVVAIVCCCAHGIRRSRPISSIALNISRNTIHEFLFPNISAMSCHNRIKLTILNRLFSFWSCWGRSKGLVAGRWFKESQSHVKIYQRLNKDDPRYTWTR